MNWKNFLIVGSVIALAGCTGGSQSSSAPAAATPKSSEFKVALVTPGPVSDAGWNAMAYDGLKACERELGAKIVNSEAQGPKIRDALRSYAQDGYSLVIGHGFEYNEPAAEIAKDFPNTVFLSSSGGKTAPNLGTCRFYLEESFFVAGYVAGTLTKSGKVAMVGFTTIPSIASTFKAFEAGAKFARPNVEVKTISLDLNCDAIAARQSTMAALNAGADMVIHQANQFAQNVFAACKEKGAYAFGANADQNSNDSGVVIGSAVLRPESVIVDVARQVKEHEFKGQVFAYGMSRNANDYIINPKFDAMYPADLKAKIDDLKAKIKSGEQVVPKDQF